jgi:hypothetical protein
MAKCASIERGVRRRKRGAPRWRKTRPARSAPLLVASRVGSRRKGLRRANKSSVIVAQRRASGGNGRAPAFARRPSKHCRAPSTGRRCPLSSRQMANPCLRELMRDAQGRPDRGVAERRERRPRLVGQILHVRADVVAMVAQGSAHATHFVPLRPRRRRGRRFVRRGRRGLASACRRAFFLGGAERLEPGRRGAASHPRADGVAAVPSQTARPPEARALRAAVSPPPSCARRGRPRAAWGGRSGGRIRPRWRAGDCGFGTSERTRSTTRRTAFTPRRVW